MNNFSFVIGMFAFAAAIGFGAEYAADKPAPPPRIIPQPAALQSFGEPMASDLSAAGASSPADPNPNDVARRNELEAAPDGSSLAQAPLPPDQPSMTVAALRETAPVSQPMPAQDAFASSQDYEGKASARTGAEPGTPVAESEKELAIDDAAFDRRPTGAIKNYDDEPMTTPIAAKPVSPAPEAKPAPRAEPAPRRSVSPAAPTKAKVAALNKEASNREVLGREVSAKASHGEATERTAERPQTRRSSAQAKAKRANRKTVAYRQPVWTAPASVIGFSFPKPFCHRGNGLYGF